MFESLENGRFNTCILQNDKREKRERERERKKRERERERVFISHLSIQNRNDNVAWIAVFLKKLFRHN